jgi:hypothetical protein
MTSTSEDGPKEDYTSPFHGMKIDDNRFLDSVQGRNACEQCYKSRKFFCYSCFCPVGDLVGKLPKVKVLLDLTLHQHMY